MNLDAWNYRSINTACNDAWMLWDEACMWWPTDECSETDAIIQDLHSAELNGLAKARNAAADSQASFGADFAKGASVGAIAALGAMFVMRKYCSKA